MIARPLILLSNDDGVAARGIRTLHAQLEAIADVVVVAPQTEQSANSHALTLARPLRHRIVDGFHAIDGTPADCIYVGLYWKDLMPRAPDLVVSGINHGYNLGSDTFYSGTVAAAREGALRGIPSIAFSVGMADGTSFDTIAPIACAIAARVLALPPREEGTRPPLLNVNFPAGVPRPAGLRATRLGRRRYEDEVDVRRDPRGREYFWIGGPNAFHDPSEGSDTEAVDHGFVSVTPLGLDATEREHMRIAERAIEGVTITTEER
ncbi:MAG: 5'/3'-nucleotidase SurE [Sandaracinaceae bacterium]|nr:5'/3'-nucleotidase SurE [Sandaracinaceae bacterium]